MGNFIHDDQYGGGDLVIGNNHGSDLWNAHYAAIANLNSAISAMKKGNLGASVPAGNLDQLMGQAKFIRAYNYFMLVRMFGDLPLLQMIRRIHNCQNRTVTYRRCICADC